MTEEGILYKTFESLESSRRGYLSNITRLCNELDESLKDFSNVVKVKTQQTRLNRGSGRGGPDPVFPLLFHDNPASRTFFIAIPNPA